MAIPVTTWDHLDWDQMENRIEFDRAMAIRKEADRAAQYGTWSNNWTTIDLSSMEKLKAAADREQERLLKAGEIARKAALKKLRDAELGKAERFLEAAGDILDQG